MGTGSVLRRSVDISYILPAEGGSGKKRETKDEKKKKTVVIKTGMNDGFRVCGVD